MVAGDGCLVQCKMCNNGDSQWRWHWIWFVCSSQLLIIIIWVICNTMGTWR
jgi:hypothetical protein